MKKSIYSSERGTSSGSCKIDHFSPQPDDLTPQTKKLNVFLPFAEASRLVMALQERLQHMHKLKRNSKEAKVAAVNLVVSLNVKNIAVMPGTLTQTEN